MNESQRCITRTVRNQLLLLLAIPALHAAVVSGSVKGSVVDDAGNPVVRARVFISQALPATALHLAGPPVITGPQAGNTMTDYKGEFQAGNLPLGNYILCVQAATPGLLDPCHWAKAAPEVTVTAGQTAAGVKITLSRGAIVPVHLNDAAKLLTPVKGTVDAGCRVHVVTAKGHHYEAPIVSQVAQAGLTGQGGTPSLTARDHALTVPFDTAVTLQLLCPHLAVNDESGSALSAAGKPILVPSGSSPAAINLTVGGTKP